VVKNYLTCDYDVKSYLWVCRGLESLNIEASLYYYNVPENKIEIEKKLQYDILFKKKIKLDKIIRGCK